MDSSPIISENVLGILVKLYGRNKDDLLQIISTSPKTSVLRVNSCHSSSKEALGILKRCLDVLPGQRKFSVTKHSILDDILLVTPDQEDQIQPRCEKEVIVDTSCGCAVLRGADIFAPGVLAAHPGMLKGDVVSVYVDLEKKCRRGLVKVFDGKKYFIGNGISLYTRQELFENDNHLKGTAIEMTHSRNQHPSFSNLDTSLFFAQNLPSICVGHLVNPQEGDLILDMCASPGGKTTHVASLLRNKGRVIAIDKTQKKIDRIVINCENLGITNVDTFCFDSTKLLSDQIDNDKSISQSTLQPPFSTGSFDKILLDPPCSGLGQRPQLHYVMKDKELRSYPVYQRRLLKQAVHLLKPGGCLVYSTCTLLTQENEEQVAWVLKTFPEMKLDHPNLHVGNHGFQGFGLSDLECQQVQRFDKCYLQGSNLSNDMEDTDEFENCFNDTIGFFIAKFVKN